MEIGLFTDGLPESVEFLEPLVLRTQPEEHPPWM